MTPDRHIQMSASDRVAGEYVVTVKGVTRFVGSYERATVIYYDLINACFSDRDKHDQALRRAISL